MADRYTLPDLAGVEVQILPRPQGPRPDGRVDVTVIQWGRGPITVTLPHRLLTPVKPPLPPEPPDTSVVRNPDPELSVRVYERDDRSCQYPRVWFAAGDEEASTWAEVCALGTPVLLAPDPFTEPVNLPFTVTDEDGDKLTVHGARHVGAVITIQHAHGVAATMSLTHDQASHVMGALWRCTHCGTPTTPAATHAADLERRP